MNNKDMNDLARSFINTYAKMNIRQILKNKVVFYLVSRYVTYAVQFVTSLVIAAELGPYYMGLWGFILLVLQYFQQFHLGIANSFNILYVQNRDNPQECNNYIANSLVLICYLSALVVLFYLYYFFIGINDVEKYHAGGYVICICLIAILQYFVQFFISLLRVKNQLNRVTFCQSIIVVLNFLCIFFFKGNQLIDSLVVGYIIGNLLCILIAFTSGSVSIKAVQFKIDCQKKILKKGWFLFLYNSSFYFIIISIRTIVSRNYTIEEFGLFTFSFTLAHAILLILEALSFIIFPKVIGKLSSKDDNEVKSTIKTLRTSYITSAHFLIYLALLVFPIVILFLPKYEGAVTSLNMIALTILMGTCTYGYLELLISRNEEKHAAFLSSFALIVNCVIALFIVHYLRISFSYVILATMITYVIFSITVIKKAGALVGIKTYFDALKEVIPLRLFIPYIIALMLSMIQAESFMFIPVFIFFILNIKTCIKMVNVVKKIIYKPEVVNLK